MILTAFFKLYFGTMKSFADIFVHFVWKIDVGSPSMQTLTRNLVERYIRESGETLGYVCVAVRALPDHVHALFWLLPGVSVGELVTMLKRQTKEYLVEKLALKDPPSWEPTYGAVSVSRAHVKDVAKYVLEQQKRHSENKINKTLERTSG